MEDRIYAQYKGKTKFKKWSDLPKNFVDTIVTAAESVRDSWDIDNNSGDQLDVIGRIVGQDNSYTQSLKFEVYECNSDGDFECGDSTAQCSSIYAASDSELTDDYYRILLKAKIAKNNSDCSIESILSVVNIIDPSLEVRRLTDGEDMTFSIEFYGSVDGITRDLLMSADIIPRPQGVRFKGFLEGYNMVECNSDGDFECGDTSAECVGFIGV